MPTLQVAQRNPTVSFREFLETFQLYRKLRMTLPQNIGDLPSPAITMGCPQCGSTQTFNMTSDYYEAGKTNRKTVGYVVRIGYMCKSCHGFSRHFLLKFDTDTDGTYVEKVGQEPQWDIQLDRVLEKELGAYSEFYRRGLICESRRNEKEAGASSKRSNG